MADSELTELGPPAAPNLTKIDRFGAPALTKMGRVGFASLTEIGRLGAPKMAKISENRPSLGPKYLSRQYQICSCVPFLGGVLNYRVTTNHLREGSVAVCARKRSDELCGCCTILSSRPKRYMHFELKLLGGGGAWGVTDVVLHGGPLRGCSRVLGPFMESLVRGPSRAALTCVRHVPFPSISVPIFISCSLGSRARWAGRKLLCGGGGGTRKPIFPTPPLPPWPQ